MLNKKEFREEKQKEVKRKPKKWSKYLSIIGMVLFLILSVLSFVIIGAVDSVLPVNNLDLDNELIASQLPNDFLLLFKLKEFEPLLQGFSILCMIAFFVLTFYFFRKRKHEK